MNAPLVELVEHDRREVREKRVLLQAGGQDALGGDQQPRVVLELALEADLPSDLPTESPAAFVGDAPGDAARGRTSGLENDGRAGIEQRRRHPCRLA